jgi:hypothetical protein
VTVCFFDRWSGMTKLWLSRSVSLVPTAYVTAPIVCRQSGRRALLLAAT